MAASGFWQIIVPQAAQNMVTNPTVTIDKTGYFSWGAPASIVQDLTKTRRNRACLKITPSSGVNDGTNFHFALTQGVTYYFSADFWGALGVPYKVAIYDGNSVLQAKTSFIGTGYWQGDRPLVAFTAGSSATYYFVAGKDSSADTNPFWTDGWQVERDQQTTYIDGNQEGCYWDGVPNGSTSERSGQTRAGGKYVNFSDYDFVVDKMTGTGMPIFQHIIIQYGLQDGGYYQRTKATPRAFSLTGTVNIDPSAQLSWNTYHANRKALESAMQIDLIDIQQPFWLRYSGVPRPMWIRAFYANGFEMNKDTAHGFTEPVTAGFIAPDPQWYEEGVAVIQLGVNQIINNARYFARRQGNGTWDNAYNGCNNAAYAMLPTPDGGIIMAGAFSTAGSPAVSAKCVAKLLGGTWSQVGSGFDDVVRGVCTDAAGNIYAVGNFNNTAGSPAVAVHHVAKYVGSDWAPVAGGVGNAFSIVYDCIIGYDGFLYVCGDFTTAGSPAVTANGVAYYNPNTNQWYSMNVGISVGGGAIVYALAKSSNNTIYAAGLFTSAGSPAIAAINVAQWNGSITSYVNPPQTWSALNTGVGCGEPGSYADALLCTDDGSVYIGGSYIGAGSPAFGVNCLARWNGNNYFPLGYGVGGGYVANLFRFADGSIGIMGTFTNVFSSSYSFNIPDGFVYWNGSSYMPNDADFPGVTTVFAISELLNGDRYFTFSTSGSMNAASVVTPSTTGKKTPMKFVIHGPGQIWKITNNNTGRAIYFNNLTLLDGETVTMTISPANVMMISDFRGNVMGYVMPGTDLSNFSLLPGNNYITLYMTGTTANTYAYMQWVNSFWTNDGGAN
jgi:hypothetical protein